MAYQVGIDLGTSAGVAAVCRGDGLAHVVPLEGATGAVASAVYLGADGALLVGEAAQRRALSDPGRVVRELTRRIGDGTPLLVGREPVAAADLAARFLARLVDDVARHEGGVAARVAVTHPGSWGPHRLGSLRAALGEQGLGSAVLLPEPVAAATGVAGQLRPGATVGVYDLGGGRFEASVVRGRSGRFGAGGAVGGARVRRGGPGRGGLRPRPRRARCGVGDARPDRPGGARGRGRPAPGVHGGEGGALPGHRGARAGGAARRPDTGAAGTRGVRGHDPRGRHGDGRGDAPGAGARRDVARRAGSAGRRGRLGAGATRSAAARRDVRA